MSSKVRTDSLTESDMPKPKPPSGAGDLPEGTPEEVRQASGYYMNQPHDCMAHQLRQLNC